MATFLGKNYTPSVSSKHSQMNYLKLGATADYLFGILKMLIISQIREMLWNLRKICLLLPSSVKIGFGSVIYTQAM